jgi:hypothetical protein
MTFKREDIKRSLHNHILTHDEFAGRAESLIWVELESPTEDLSEWYEIHLASLYPDSTRMADQIMRGSLRVLCKTRKQPSEESNFVDVYLPDRQVDRVETCLRGANIEVRDYVENGGSTVTGIIHCDEVQIDDVGEADDHVRTIICTTQILVSAA